MVDKLSESKSSNQLIITWEPLPKDFRLEDEPVENIDQPILAGALRESLEISGFIQPQMLIASNFGLCATVNGQLIIKGPDWVYVPLVKEVQSHRKSYTPILEGEIPLIVMEFLSETNRGEYSVKRTYPPGRWFFYERILQVPIYIIFAPNEGLLEYYQLENGRYQLKLTDENGRHWIDKIGLYLGIWQGTKEAHTGYWLRWWDKDGNLLAWAVEQIEQERQQKERLIAYLQSQGIDPNNLPQFE